MSKIDTIETISDTLGASSILVTPKRCVYIRNWHSTCKKCLNACKHDAIVRSLGHISIDHEKCTDCGACVAACPTSTFATTAPTAADIVKQARESAGRNAGSAVFICEKKAAEHNVDTSRVVVLPCLDYLDEYLIAGMFGLGFKRVVLLDPPLGQVDRSFDPTHPCEGCEMDCSRPFFEEVVENARKALDLWDVPGVFAVLDEVPETLIDANPHAHASKVSSNRRDAFEQAGASAIDYAWQAARNAMGALSGDALEDPDRQIVMKVEERFDPASYRSIRLLKTLEENGTHPPDGACVDTRLWASIDVDPSRCKHCGICARMCITQALQYHVDEENRATLTFRPALCTNCRLCRDSCISHSMIYTTNVPAQELEPHFTKTLFENEEIVTNKVNPFG